MHEGHAMRPLVVCCVLLVIGNRAWGQTADAGKAVKGKLPGPHLARAIETIKGQVEWFGPKPGKYSREFLIGLATMNHVQSRLSPLNYAVLLKGNEKLPGNAEECLSRQAGICGNQVAAFLAIVGRLGVRARPVEFYLRGSVPAKNHSHVGAEIFYGGRWHFFDVTWGTFYRRPGGKVDDLLAWGEIQKAKDARGLAITNGSDLWFLQWRAAGLDPLEYVDAKEMDVLTGHAGTIHLRGGSVPKSRSLLYTPTHQPNYVGRNSADRDTGSVKVRLLETGPKPGTLVIEVLGVAGRGSLRVEGEQGSASVALSSIKAGPLRLDLSKFTVKSGLSLYVVGQQRGGVGYVVYQRIAVHGRP